MDPFMIEFQRCSSAQVSPCGKWRYGLSRQWAERDAFATFIMLNPSTPNATQDDPTIRRFIAFAKRCRISGIDVGNLFACRSTDPRVLLGLSMTPVKIIGPDNHAHLQRMVQASRKVICAWGPNGRLLDQDQLFREWMRDLRIPLHALQFNKGG